MAIVRKEKGGGVEYAGESKDSTPRHITSRHAARENMGSQPELFVPLPLETRSIHRLQNQSRQAKAVTYKSCGPSLG